MTADKSASASASYRRYLAAMTLFHQAAADSVGLSGTDYQATNLLDLDGPCTSGELAARLGLTSGATTRLVDRLIAAGIATRVVDPLDRRRTLISGTGVLPEGLDAIIDRVREPLGAAIAALTSEQRAGVDAYVAAAAEAYASAARGLRSADDGA